MPSVIRLGIDPSVGHCFGPRPADTANQGSVYANDVLMVVVGGHYPVHSCGKDSHDGVASMGSPSVFVEGSAVHRTGDTISCGDTSGNGSPNVFANG